MITKDELLNRVATRKQELEVENEKLIQFRNKVTAFIEDIKGRSTIYKLIKNLPIWKELEKLIEEVDSNAD